MEKPITRPRRLLQEVTITADSLLGEIKHQPLRAISRGPVAAADQLRADELDAGATWAKVHNANTVASCPANSRVFYAGCVAAMRGEWPLDPDDVNLGQKGNGL